MTLKSEFLNVLQERGFIHQCTDLDGLDALMAQEKITAYIGFDCTARSLHVGSLMQIMILRWLQKCGHTPIVLMGGGTTKIGDPSGKDEARKLLTDDDIANNMAGIRAVFDKFLSFGHNEAPDNAALMLNNDEWLRGLNYLDFLRDYGRHFSVNRMMSMDSVKLRLEREQNLSFLEFNYMILQAYDFVELNRRHACRLQIGGSDQWGNIVNGVELGRKLYAEQHITNLPSTDILAETDNYKNHYKLHGLTSPLITTASGAKMGKTAAGAVWLNADMCSPYDYWQFWRNTEDADVGRFLRFFTELRISEIARLESLQGAEINEAKKILATEATALCHGRVAAEAAAETARKTFEEGTSPAGLPEVIITASELADGLAVAALFQKSGLATSNSEAKKLIQGGGARINDTAVSDINARVGAADFTNGPLKLSAGKKRHVIVRVG